MTPASSLPIERLFSEQLERALVEHQGKWVAILGEAVVASGDTPTTVLRTAAELGHTDVLLHFVFDGNEAYFF